MTRAGVGLGALALTAAVPALAANAEGPVEVMEVTAERLARPAARRAFPVTRIDGQALQQAPALRLDDILQQVPGFSLFRRQSSLVANPTTQGVSLRGIGPNGAGRTLVLLDGVPLNDPFGGWVYWSALTPDALAGVDVLRGGGAGAFGNQALAGTVSLTSRRPAAGHGSVRGRAGAFDTLDVSARGTLGLGDAALTVGGRAFESDGYLLVPDAAAGPGDIPAATDIATLNATLAVPMGAATDLTATVRGYDETRNNGFRREGNKTQAWSGALRWVHAPASGVTGTVTAYYRTRDFSQTFAIFDGTGIRQVLDQFDVPGQGAGLLGKVRVPLGGAGALGLQSLEWGLDVRYQDGETNERFRNLGDGFTRVRQAGGEQFFAGSWVEVTAAPSSRIDLTAGGRVDHWRVFDGVRRERSLETGAILRDDAIADRANATVNGRVGMVYRATPALRLRVAGYSGFRVPTINEFFRPFRVGNDITEANPALSVERLYGLNAGMSWQPVQPVRLELGYFRNWLNDAVGNVTLAQGPGFFPPTGFVPAGGSLRQRRNIDRIVADGVEFSGRVKTERWSLGLRYQFVDSRIAAFVQQPDLVGNRVAQSPRQTVTARAAWSPVPAATLGLTARHESARFDNDRNTRRLDPVTTVNLRGDWRLGRGVGVFVAVENLFDAAIQTRVSGEGVPTLGQPRMVSGGVDWRF